jgi:hypothetical protein
MNIVTEAFDFDPEKNVDQEIDSVKKSFKQREELRNMTDDMVESVFTEYFLEAAYQSFGQEYVLENLPRLSDGDLESAGGRIVDGWYPIKFSGIKNPAYVKFYEDDWVNLTDITPEIISFIRKNLFKWIKNLWNEKIGDRLLYNWRSSLFKKICQRFPANMLNESFIFDETDSVDDEIESTREVLKYNRTLYWFFELIKFIRNEVGKYSWLDYLRAFDIVFIDTEYIYIGKTKIYFSGVKLVGTNTPAVFDSELEKLEQAINQSPESQTVKKYIHDIFDKLVSNVQNMTIWPEAPIALKELHEAFDFDNDSEDLEISSANKDISRKRFEQEAPYIFKDFLYGISRISGNFKKSLKDLTNWQAAIFGYSFSLVVDPEGNYDDNNVLFETNIYSDFDKISSTQVGINILIEEIISNKNIQRINKFLAERIPVWLKNAKAHLSVSGAYKLGFEDLEKKINSEYPSLLNEDFNFDDENIDSEINSVNNALSTKRIISDIPELFNEFLTAAIRIGGPSVFPNIVGRLTDAMVRISGIILTIKDPTDSDGFAFFVSRIYKNSLKDLRNSIENITEDLRNADIEVKEYLAKVLPIWTSRKHFYKSLGMSPENVRWVFEDLYNKIKKEYPGIMNESFKFDDNSIDSEVSQANEKIEENRRKKAVTEGILFLKNTKKNYYSSSMEFLKWITLGVKDLKEFIDILFVPFGYKPSEIGVDFAGDFYFDLNPTPEGIKEKRESVRIYNPSYSQIPKVLQVFTENIGDIGMPLEEYEKIYNS